MQELHSPFSTMSRSFSISLFVHHLLRMTAFPCQVRGYIWVREVRVYTL